MNPEKGAKPTMHRNKVDFPDPEGPLRVTFSPACMDKYRLLKRGTFPKITDTLFTSSMNMFFIGRFECSDEKRNKIGVAWPIGHEHAGLRNLNQS
jgi:hypothetical protein